MSEKESQATNDAEPSAETNDVKQSTEMNDDALDTSSATEEAAKDASTKKTKKSSKKSKKSKKKTKKTKEVATETLTTTTMQAYCATEPNVEPGQRQPPLTQTAASNPPTRTVLSKKPKNRSSQNSDHSSKDGTYFFFS